MACVVKRETLLYRSGEFVSLNIKKSVSVSGINLIVWRGLFDRLGG